MASLRLMSLVLGLWKATVRSNAGGRVVVAITTRQHLVRTVHANANGGYQR